MKNSIETQARDLSLSQICTLQFSIRNLQSTRTSIGRSRVTRLPSVGDRGAFVGAELRVAASGRFSYRKSNDQRQSPLRVLRFLLFKKTLLKTRLPQRRARVT